jgi:hypothetical protein
LRKKLSTQELPRKFNAWLDAILADINELPIAWNFNLYDPPRMELVGTKSFHKNDEDWACDEIFTSSDSHADFVLPEKTWEESLADAVSLIKNYLENGKYKSKLIESHAVACGFVDGDLELLYVNPNKKFRQKKEKITMEKINSLPFHQLYAWITVYTDYEKSDFCEKIDGFMYEDKKPTREDMDMMRKFLFESLSKKKK